MAAIRVPSNATDLLPFCQRDEHARPDACFETYAHMLAIAACLGYRLASGPASRSCQSFLKTPGPIDLGIFRSQGLFSQLLIISMMCHPDNDAALDEANLVRSIEDLAEAGLEEMCMALTSKGASSFPEVLAGWIAEGPPTGI